MKFRKVALALLGLKFISFLLGCVEEHHHHYTEIENNTETITEKEILIIREIPIYETFSENEIILDIKDIMRNCGENHEHYPEWAMEDKGDGTKIFNYYENKDWDVRIAIGNMHFNCIADTVISKYGRAVTATGTATVLDNGDVETIKPNQIIVGEKKSNLVLNTTGISGAIANGSRTRSYDGGVTSHSCGFGVHPFELTIDD